LRGDRDRILDMVEMCDLLTEHAARRGRRPRPAALSLVDVVIEIPMVGVGASLNVAVAGSLVLYRLAGLM
jgi:hypothetical protein